MKLIITDTPLHILINSNAIELIDLSTLKIANCIGCFGCWTKTPGKCVIRDDATQVYPKIAKSDTLLYITQIQYGCYDTIMKTMLERALATQQAFIRLHHGETHHVQRNVVPKKATIVGYGNLTSEEKEVFQALVARNAHNMSFESYQVQFLEKNQLESFVQSKVTIWEKS